VSAEEACNRQVLRERHVPEDIIFAQSKRMSTPTYNEGWDFITYNEDNEDVWNRCLMCNEIVPEG
jgi:predicted kinase